MTPFDFQKWQKYFDDVAFQTWVVRQAKPEWEVRPWLLMPDKSKTNPVEGIGALFRVESEERNGRWYREAFFEGSEDDARACDILTAMDASDALEQLLPEVEGEAERLFHVYIDVEARPANPPLSSKTCKKCEYRKEGEDGRCGFRECWGELADADPHLLDLYYLVDTGRQATRYDDGRTVWERAIADSDMSLASIDGSALRNGARATRQKIQVEYSRRGREYVDREGLQQENDRLEYPLHFIDFEGTRLAVPVHRGMLPYSQVMFQWSCHTLDTPDAEPTHAEFLDLDLDYPNVRFAERLLEEVGDTGSLVIFHKTYERTALKDIAEQIPVMAPERNDLAEWIRALLADKARFVDLKDWVIAHYWHPRMKGSNSIKDVLPAVWGSTPELWEIPWFQRYFRTGEDGVPVDPYETLEGSDLIADDDDADVVKNGSAAMAAYLSALHEAGLEDPARREALKQQLREYCRLDTMAMVMIWEGMRRKAGM